MKPLGGPDQPSTGADHQGTVAQIGLFALVHGLTVALFIVLIRRELGAGLASTWVALMHLAALVGAVTLLVWWFDRGAPNEASTPFAIALGGIAGYCLPLVGLVLGPWALLPSIVISICGVAAIVVITLRAMSVLRLLVILLGGVLSGLILAVSLNGLHYAHMFAYEFAVLGWQAGDTVFHSAIAALFPRYWLQTTGVDGTPPLFYHVFSHVLIAALSEEAGELVLLTYPPAQQVFFIPALLFGTALVAASLADFRRDVVFLVPLMVVLSWQLYEWFGAYNSFVLSESYAVSLGLFSLGLPLVLGGPGKGIARGVSWFAAVSLIGLLSIVAKFTMAFAWLIVAARALWVREHRARPCLAWLVLAAAGLAYLLLIGALVWRTGGWDAAQFFGYAKTYPRLYEVSLCVAAIGIISAFFVRSENREAPTPFLLLVMAVLLHLPDVFINDGAGGAYYWFHASDHVASAMAIAAIVLLVARASLVSRWAAPVAGAALVVAIPLVAINVPGFIPHANSLANSLIALDRLAGMERILAFDTASKKRAHAYAREQLAPDRAEPWSARTFAALIASAKVIAGKVGVGTQPRLAGIIAGLPLSRAAAAVRNQAQGSVAGRPGVFVDPDSDWLWQHQKDCIARQFIFQSLTGVALLRGLAPISDRCTAASGYGLSSYDEASRNRVYGREALCGAARGHDISPVFRVSRDRIKAEIVCK